MEEEGENSGEDCFGKLPEGLLSFILSLTTPSDACRVSAVSSAFKSASEWDSVWEKFLPSDHRHLISRSVDRDGTPLSLLYPTKKELYLHLCDHPILIDGGSKSFWLDKSTGKKLYMLSPRSLSISWGDEPQYWRWNSRPQSRFAEVAELLAVCWLEIHGTIDTWMLSSSTTYSAYLVFDVTEEAYGFSENVPAEVSVGIRGLQCGRRTVNLGVLSRRRRRRPTESADLCPKRRADGWWEVELGEYCNDERGDGGWDLQMSFWEVRGENWKSGIVVEGIEIRLKVDEPRCDGTDRGGL